MEADTGDGTVTLVRPALGAPAADAVAPRVSGCGRRIVPNPPSRAPRLVPVAFRYDRPAIEVPKS
ncbi:hypothetical protein GCM10020256_53320 [Streptomyces thermocoprophilus]|jgi:hypothetical protein